MDGWITSVVFVSLGAKKDQKFGKATSLPFVEALPPSPYLFVVSKNFYFMTSAGQRAFRPD